MPQQTNHKEPEQTKSNPKTPQPEQLLQKNVAGNADSTSLVDALQSLVMEMSKADNEAEAEAGLKKLNQIRSSFLGSGAAAGSTDSARRNAEAMIALVETRVEQLRQLLARKRRIQEGMVMEQIAKQREAEGPSLLPTELIDAVVRSTDAKDPEAVKTSAPPSPQPDRKETEQAPKKATPAPANKPERAEERFETAGQPSEPEKPAELQPVQGQPAEAKPAQLRKTERSRFEQLAAHMAAMFREDPKYFDRLRRAAKRPGRMLRAPEDNGVAERHYRTVHDLNKRLVNLELHTRALAAAEQKNEKHTPLLKTAAREIKLFLKELKAGKEARPEMAQELDRLFGGWAEQFAAIKPEKGQEILNKCQAEQNPERQPGARQAKNPEAEAPQLVLRRRENWEQ